MLPTTPLRLNHLLPRARRLLHMPGYRALAGYAKRKVKKAVGFIFDFGDSMAHDAQLRGVAWRGVAWRGWGDLRPHPLGFRPPDRQGPLPELWRLGRLVQCGRRILRLPPRSHALTGRRKAVHACRWDKLAEATTRWSTATTVVMSRTRAGFSPRACAGRDVFRVTWIQSSTGFNPRARAGRDSPRGRIHCPYRCFNPRARAGRDAHRRVGFGGDDRVSIHAPVRGATRAARRLQRRLQSFNPRARAGRDDVVSQTLQSVAEFQSTRPCGARPQERTNERLDRKFQSTRPCGARPSRPRRTGHRRRRFQSTRPCGARPDRIARDEAIRRVSIHAPVRGATGMGCCGRSRRLRFNPRARAGRDAFEDRTDDLKALVSIHAPVRGATVSVCPRAIRSVLFQSTRPCGARPPKAAKEAAPKFQSTRPCGARPRQYNMLNL